MQAPKREYIHLASEDTEPGYWHGQGKGFTGLGAAMMGADGTGMDGLGDEAADWAALAQLTPAQQQALVAQHHGPTQITTEAYKILTPVQAQFYFLCTGNGHNDPYSETGCLAEAKRVTGPTLTPKQLGAVGAFSGLVSVVAVGALAGLGYLWWRRR